MVVHSVVVVLPELVVVHPPVAVLHRPEVVAAVRLPVVMVLPELVVVHPPVAVLHRPEIVAAVRLPVVVVLLEPVAARAVQMVRENELNARRVVDPTPILQVDPSPIEILAVPPVAALIQAGSAVKAASVVVEAASAGVVGLVLAVVPVIDDPTPVIDDPTPMTGPVSGAVLNSSLAQVVVAVEGTGVLDGRRPIVPLPRLTRRRARLQRPGRWPNLHPSG